MLILYNFKRKKSSFLTLTFGSQEGLDEDNAKAIFKIFIDRLRDNMKRRGMEKLKYIKIMERGENGDNLHFHLVVNLKYCDETKQLIEKLWKNGHTNTKEINFDSESIYKLAYYICKESKPNDDDFIDADDNNKKKFNEWSRSRNVVNPKDSTRDIFMSDKKISQLYEDIVQRNDSTKLEKLFSGYTAKIVVARKNEEYNEYSFKVLLQKEKTYEEPSFDKDFRKRARQFAWLVENGELSSTSSGF